MNYTQNPDETISVASALIDKTNQEDVKYDALRFLAYAYKAKGAYLLDGKPKYEAKEKQKWISFENLLQMMEKIAESTRTHFDS